MACKNFPFFILSLIIIINNVINVQSDRNNKAKIIVVGPGINTIQLAFPSRYFFILHQNPNIGTIKLQTKKNFNINLNENCYIHTKIFNKTRFCIKFNYNDIDKNKFETLNEILNLAKYCDDEDLNNDNNLIRYWLTIVRYSFQRKQWKCNQPLELLIFNDDQNQIPIYRRIIKSKELTFYSEHCKCVDNDWSILSKCNSNDNKKLYKQIETDLLPFKSGINFTKILNEAIDRFGNYPQTYAFCHYKIKNNQAYKKCYGQYDGFSKFFDRMLLSLMRKTKLNDNELLMNLGDWPLSSKMNKIALPIFSWSGSEKTNDIVLPTYELTESLLNGHDRIETDIFSIFGEQNLSFTNKINKLFWRGRDSNEIRLKLIDQSKLMPDYFNVSITNFFFFRDQISKYRNETDIKNNKIPYVKFKQFFDYRYQINIDGTVAAYRLPFLLSSNSLIIKQKSIYYEYFYHLLKSNEHFLLIDESINDLPELLKNLIDNNQNNNLNYIKNIIWNSRLFVLKWLLPSSIYCYYYNALESYSKLLLSSNIDSTTMNVINDDDDLQYYGTCINGCQKNQIPKHTKDEL